MNSPRHVPVLLDRVVALLAPGPRPRAGAVMVDATLGLGGHTRGACSPGAELARVVGIDRDPAALELAGRAAGRRSVTAFTGVHAVYDELPDVLAELGPRRRRRRALRPRRLLACSSTSRERGFAYAEDAPLDMRISIGFWVAITMNGVSSW